MSRKLSLLLVLALILGLSGPSFSQPGRRAQASQASGEPVQLKGEITNILKPLASFKADGKEFTVHLGPVWYWKQESLELKKGEVLIFGEKEEIDGEWHLYAEKIVQDKNEIVLRTEDGLPKWAATGAAKGRASRGFRHHRCGHCGHGCRY